MVAAAVEVAAAATMADVYANNALETVEALSAHGGEPPVDCSSSPH